MLLAATGPSAPQCDPSSHDASSSAPELPGSFGGTGTATAELESDGSVLALGERDCAGRIFPLGGKSIASPTFGPPIPDWLSSERRPDFARCLVVVPRAIDQDADEICSHGSQGQHFSDTGCATIGAATTPVPLPCAGGVLLRNAGPSAPLFGASGWRPFVPRRRLRHRQGTNGPTRNLQPWRRRFRRCRCDPLGVVSRTPNHILLQAPRLARAKRNAGRDRNVACTCYAVTPCVICMPQVRPRKPHIHRTPADQKHGGQRQRSEQPRSIVVNVAVEPERIASARPNDKLGTGTRASSPRAFSTSL